MRFWGRLPLATRLSALAIVSLLPLAVLLVLLHLEDVSTHRKAGLADATTYAHTTADLLDGFARDLDSFTAGAALVLGSTNQPITQANSPYLKDLAARYPNVSALFVTDLSGHLLAQSTGEDATGLDLSNRPYIKALEAGAETSWSGVLVNNQNHQLSAAFGRVVVGPDKQPAAYLVATFQPSKVGGSRPAGLPKDANLVLIDQNGTMLFSLDDDVSLPQDLSGDPQIKQALAGDFVTFKAATTAFDPNGKRYGALAPVPHMKWVLGYSRSQHVLDASLQHRLYRNLSILFAVAALTILVLVVVARRFVKPLQRLAAAADDIAEGRRVAVPASGSDPDVSKLERAFAAMTSAVAQREDRPSEQARVLATLGEVGASLASNLDLDQTVQAITNAGTTLTEAAFGAFLPNRAGAGGEDQKLDGAQQDALDGFPMPDYGELFAAAFHGDGPVRLDDVPVDARSAQEPLEPAAGPSLRSYLAVPVRGGSGEMKGVLCFGHPEAAHFTLRHEELAAGIADWAAVALNNASLYSEARRVQDELRRSNTQKDEFLGLVSHELRTPTTTIYGGVRLLETRGHMLGEEASAELVHTMSEEAERLVRLIENLLIFARLELGRASEPELVSLPALARQVVDTFTRSHRHRQLEFACAEGLLPVAGQPVMLQQVMSNLISNADKYSPPAESIAVSLRTENGEQLFTVRDHGTGVADAELTLIFESFYRSEQATQVATGHGLGLSISKRIIDANDGRIWAQNLPEGGFEVGFALLELAITPDSAEHDAVPDAVQASNGHSASGTPNAIEAEAASI